MLTPTHPLLTTFCFDRSPDRLKEQLDLYLCLRYLFRFSSLTGPAGYPVYLLPGTGVQHTQNLGCGVTPPPPCNKALMFWQSKLFYLIHRLLSIIIIYLLYIYYQNNSTLKVNQCLFTMLHIKHNIKNNLNTKAPSTRMRFHLKTQTICCVFMSRQHENDVSFSMKTKTFENALQSGKI